MRKQNLTVLLTLGTLLMSSCSSSDAKKAHRKSAAAINNDVSIVSNYTQGWPASSIKAAKELIQKYGRPSESTPSFLVWENLTPFKRIVVYREEVVHKFPLLHQDVMEHIVSYKAPAEKMDDLFKFNGSVNFNRTTGELSARCGSEAMNVLSLNLAHDIFSGRRSVSSARTELSRQAMDHMNGNKGTHTEFLLFEQQYSTADTDMGILNQLDLKQAQEETIQEETLLKAQEEEMTE